MRIMLRATAFSSALAGLALANSAQAAQTSDASAEQDDVGLEEIVVTATRRETLASDTPVALTAISGEGLVSSGVTNPTELADLVPNLSIDRANGGVQITIRGVTSTDTSEKGDPSSAFMLDGVYIARPQAQEVSFYDIARVEVLRGPQGTLYGRNTTAGLINVITNRPTFDEFGGSANVAAGNFGTLQGTGVVNVPLSDSFAIRAAVNYDQRDNYIDAGPQLTGDIDPFKENISGRLQSLYDWSSGNALVTVDYSDIQGTTYELLPLRNFFAATTTGVNPVYIGDDRSSDDLRRVNAPIAWDTFRDNSTWGVGAEINQDIGPVTVTYTGSYREFTRDEQDARIGMTGAEAYRSAFEGDYEQTSQELRVANNGDGALQLQGGVYYFKEESTILQRLLLTPNSGRTGDGTTLGFAQGPTVAESHAAFAQGTFAFTDSLRLTTGVRYSEDQKSRVGNTVSCASFFTCGPTTGASPSNNADVEFSKTTWRAGLDYDLTPDTMVYGTVSTGYKAGGFNDGCVLGTGTGCTQPRDLFYYEPEELKAYEVGVKTALFDNTLTVNAAAFLYDYTNIQLSQLVAECFGPGSGPCNVTTNGGEAEVSGVEIEAAYAPTRADRIDLSLAYLDAHFTDFRPNPTTDFSGKSLDRSPEWAATLGYLHTFQLGNGGNIVGGIRSRYSDAYTLVILGTLNFYEQPSYTKTDVTLTYNAPKEAWYLQGFAKNLEDSIVVTTVAVGVRSSVQISEPFTYGLRAGFNF